jgi:hypothetical protein
MLLSSNPPVLSLQELLAGYGQKGVIPSFVRLSTNKWIEYPRKNPKLAAGTKNASKIETAMQKVKL